MMRNLAFILEKNKSLESYYLDSDKIWPTFWKDISNHSEENKL